MKGIISVICLTSSILNYNVDFNDLKLNNNDNYQYEDDNIKIIGNNELDLNLFDYKNLDKDFLYFNVNSLNELKSIYYNNFTKETNYLYSTSTNQNIIIKEINYFYKENNEKISLYSNEEDEKIHNTSIAGTIKYIAKPYGKINLNYSLKRYDSNKNTSLYFFDLNSEFTPGFDIKKSGENEYEDYYINFANINIQAFQLEIDTDYNERWSGGKPIFKDSYPVSGPKNVSITSSYSRTYVFGLSSMFGFKESQYTSSNTYSYSTTITYGYSKTYNETEPILSTHNGSKDNDYHWNFYYDSPSRFSFTERLGYIFEMNDYNDDNENVKNRVFIKISRTMELTESLSQNSKVVKTLNENRYIQ